MTSLPAGLGPLGERTPVLVGLGTASADASALELMRRAVVAAGSDAGSATLLARVDRVAVPKGTWDYADPGRLVAEAVGCPTARSHLTELGVPQQGLINQALSAIATGRSEVALVVGGEAKRWARDHPDTAAAEADRCTTLPDEVHRPQGSLLEPVEVAHRLWDPVQQYAMIDNALRWGEGRSLAEHRREIADLWARFNGVAQANPEAAFPDPLDAAHIDTPSASNRPLAFPYNKWHSTQWTVNQAAALVLCSAGTAARHGVPPDRWVFPRVGVESGHAVSLLRRVAPHTWPAMEVLGRAASGRIGRPLGEVEVVEAYSCFPAAVRVQQRALGLGADSTPTITGGMAFAGGPFNNFVFQATVAVARAVREGAGLTGAVTTVSGLLTKPGLGVWADRPDGQVPLVGDLALEVAAVTPALATEAVVEAIDGYRGGATVVTYTVTYDGMEPVRAVALCDTDDGRRCVAVSDERSLAGQATTDELVATRIHVEDGSFRPV